MKPIVRWQYEKLEDQAGLLEEHLADPECPCSSEGESCARKHLKRLEAYAQETLVILVRDPKSSKKEADELERLAVEAREFRLAEEKHLCGKKVPEKELVSISWASNWRKYFETMLVATCEVKATVADISPAIANLAESAPAIKISGTCRPDKDCTIKVKAVKTTEGQTGSIENLSKLIQEISERASQETAPVTNKTFAQGTTNVTRYEFDFEIVDAAKIGVSHDPFTFVPNPEYPQELQPRLRERAATRLQVERIAANLDPDSLLIDYHSIDRGAPIVGPDYIVESGNGRIMALVYASRNYPDQYAVYVQALRDIAPKYNLSPAKIDRLEIPVLVRKRTSTVNRKQFVEEANASTTIETSAIEKARTDAAKITIEMLNSLEVLEGENIEDALRASRNSNFVRIFLSKLSQNEQARLVDSKGQLNQDGVRRATMALFVATFKGDIGLRLAERFFESTDPQVRNVFNGLARSLGPLALAESMTAAGEREPEYAIGEDLAKAIGVFSAIKKTPGMTVAKYLQQSQLFERELDKFQERILAVLDDNSRSAKRIGQILGAYSEMVISSPPPAQVSLIPGSKATKAELFESAVSRAELSDFVGQLRAAKKEKPAAGPFAWIINKLQSCGLPADKINRALNYRPLRDFIVWAIDQRTGPVRICETSLGVGAYQVSVDGLNSKQTAEAGKLIGKIPTARRVWSREGGYFVEVLLPADPETLTWQPQEVHQGRARPPEGEQATLFRRVRYNRADINSTISAARKIVTDQPLYIFATAYGFTIEKQKPIGSQQYVIVKPDGSTELIDPLDYLDDIDYCSEARAAWAKYQADKTAGHGDAAPFWKGQAEVYSMICAGLKDRDPGEERRTRDFGGETFVFYKKFEDPRAGYAFLDLLFTRTNIIAIMDPQNEVWIPERYERLMLRWMDNPELQSSDFIRD